MSAPDGCERKARFVDFLRRVREGERLVITLHGEPVAELRPIDSALEPLDARLRRLERYGLPVRTAWDFLPLVDCVGNCVESGRRNGAWPPTSRSTTGCSTRPSASADGAPSGKP